MSDWKDRAAASIIAGSLAYERALLIMEGYRTWAGCTECLPGCEVQKSRSRMMCPRFAVHIDATISEHFNARSACMDCGTGHHSCPPLHDHIWRSIADDGFLCWPCAEKRLGRALTFDDLMPCGWNSFAIFQHTGRMVTVADKISGRLPDLSSRRPAQPWRNPTTMREPRWQPRPAMPHLSNRARDQWFRERYRAAKRRDE